MTLSDPRCSTCGASLKIVPIQVPVYKWITNEVTGLPEKVWDRWEWKDDVQDCVRCQGAY